MSEHWYRPEVEPNRRHSTPDCFLFIKYPDSLKKRSGYIRDLKTYETIPYSPNSIIRFESIAKAKEVFYKLAEQYPIEYGNFLSTTTPPDIMLKIIRGRELNGEVFRETNLH